ncbi:hypothetical protein [Corynebacterium sp.]|uniref:hypothetical protein n=1 Tax=Corynebacterium sp. TaxID=1720 RepID=UPI0026DB685B|nr:hypothetical protein [Corynebacterium sp.]MDO4610679.1 hypothetical protein [Corynebacterium sp.]
MYEIVDFLAQNPVGLRGADFGKASPIGLLILVVLLVVILAAGWDLTRRLKRMRLRREFAAAHGMDPFDLEAIDAAMAKEFEAGRTPRAENPETVDESLEELRDRRERG